MAKIFYVQKAQPRWVRDENGKPTDVRKPLEVCDYDNEPIEVGTAYRHTTIKTGPRSSRRFTRHAGCPVWHSWELRTNAATTIERAVFDFEQATRDAEDADAFTSAAAELASTINEVAEEKRESASNIEEGFGHPTSQSEELEGVAEELEEWATELEAYQPDDPPEKCETCDGKGTIDEPDGSQVDVPCPDCDGVDHDEAMDSWREEQADQFNTDGSPL